MQQFVPLIDDLKVVSPELLVPYQVGHPCFHWEIHDASDLPDEIAADEMSVDPPQAATG